MTAKTDKAERKKSMNEFFSLLTVPFMLNIIGSGFFDMAVVAFGGGAPGGGRPGRGLSFGFSLSFGLMVLAVYLWGRPAFTYVRTAEERLKHVIRRRLANVYRDAFFMLLAAQAAALAVSSSAPGLVSKTELAAAAVSLLAQCAMLVVYIDANLSKQKLLIESLYSPEELSRPRQGFFIPVSTKITVMVAGFALLPFALVYLASFNQVPWDLLSPRLVILIFVSSVMLITGLGSIHNGVQLPLNKLIERMRAVARGEYVKTRIYFSDEVASLKAGYNEMVEGLKEREALHDTFGKYLSIEIARELIKNKKVNLGGEDMEAAVMFCDIRNFTPLSENLSASGVVEFLNKYFHYITPPITANNGVINKFIGDAVMAIYTPMLGSENFTLDAVRSALEMRRALAEFNASGAAPAPVEFGIGVHSGRLVAGNIGTLARLEFTFIGDTVNIASRLESKTKDLGTDILVSGPVLEGLGREKQNFRFESVGRVALKGKAGQMELYKLL